MPIKEHVYAAFSLMFTIPARDPNIYDKNYDKISI